MLLEITIGSRYTGPGVLTVGRLGTKKQVVLPAANQASATRNDCQLVKAHAAAALNTAHDDDLEAGQPPAQGAALLALGDFEPAGR